MPFDRTKNRSPWSSLDAVWPDSDMTVVHATERRIASRTILSKLARQIATITVVKLESSYVRLLDSHKDRYAIFQHLKEMPSFSALEIAVGDADNEGNVIVGFGSEDMIASLGAIRTILVVDLDNVSEIAESGHLALNSSSHSRMSEG